MVCYFGKLPNYSRLVMRSAATNPSIDWFIFGDTPPDYDLPANVQFLPLTMPELQQIMEDACDTPVRIDQPIDLTRLKPTYGLCFTKRLVDYDFWGHVDLDMIYGDLRKFLPPELLEDYLRVHVRGHLSLYRNTTEVNRLFMLQAPGAPDYREILANRDRTQFDEWPGIWKIFRYHQIPQYHAEVIADIKPPNWNYITRFEAEELPNHPHQVFYWHGGKTFQAYYHREGGLFDHEVAYVHFQKRVFPEPPPATLASPGFLVGPGGFTPYDRENLSPSEMDTLNAPIPRSFAERRKLRIRRWMRALEKRRVR